MKFMRKEFAALILVASASTNASAVCDGCVVAAVGGAATAITGAISVSTTLLLNEIAGSSMAAAKVVVSGVGASVTQSAEMITENDNKVTTQVRAVEVARRRRIQDPCVMIAATKMPALQAAVTGVSGTYGRGGNGGGSSFSSGGGSSGGGASRQNILAIANGKAPPPSTEVLASNAARWACGDFAAGNPLRRQMCVDAGMSAGNGAGRPDADVRSETLFDGPQDTYGVTKMRRTISGDPDGADRVAVEAYLRNMSSPLELRNLGKNELKTEDGRRYLALRDTYEARMSLATRAFRDMAGNKTESPLTVPVLEALRKSDSTKDYVNSRLSAIPGWSSKGVSAQELRAIEAERRHMNLKWREFIAKASEQELAAEQLQIGAYQIVLQTELLEELGKFRAELGNLTTASVRSEMLPMLQRQHAAATR